MPNTSSSLSTTTLNKHYNKIIFMYIPQALILVPTRELTIQVKKDVFNVGILKKIKTVAL